MANTGIKDKLLKAIVEVDDEKLLEVVYHFLNMNIQTSEYELTDEDKVDLDERMARDKAGLEKSYSWEEVKDMIRNKKEID